jgi:hypothetical protein
LAKTGRKPEEDDEAIHLMVKLRAGREPPMKVRAAAREAAQQLGLKGSLKTHEERLRAKYRRLEKAGQLPTAEQKSETAKRQIRAMYAERAATEARLRRELANLERQAVEMGIDISNPNLFYLLASLRREEARLGSPIALLAEEFPTVEQALAEWESREKRLPEVKEALKVVAEISERRSALGLDDDLA